ncbi:MAG: hypothetical protein MJ193_02350 [Clostridia bacterium]|nr:hypothetical protein [Clostridia bacterium]
MLQSLTWILNIISTILGAAGTLIVCGALVFLFSLAKKLPSKIRQIVKTTVALFFTLALFKGLAVQMLYYLFSRSMQLYIVFGIADIVGAMGMIVLSICAIGIFLPMGRVRFEGVSTGSNYFIKRDKKSTSSSFTLKVSSVLLQ